MSGPPPGPTAGRDALAEAARLEMARVYGQLCHEHKQPVDEMPPVTLRLVRDNEQRRSA